MKSLFYVLAALTLAAQPGLAAKMTVLHRDMPVLGTTASNNPSTNFAPAPTPNMDLNAPRDSNASLSQPQWRPDIAPNQHQAVHPGEGLVPGSAFTDALGRRHPVNPLGITPTFNLKVPLQ
jgi:hypothetical protein